VPDSHEPHDIFHFPDGNASLARLFVRSLIPAAVPGKDMEDIVTSRVDYARLDEASSKVRIRLKQHRGLGDPRGRSGKRA
jgi:spermidine dehydrogenase